MNRQLVDLLYKSFDAELSDAERKLLEDGLSNSPTLRDEKKRIEEIRRKIAATGRNSFSEGFADRVMKRIVAERPELKPDLFFESLFSVFRPVAIAALVLIGVIISYNMAAAEDISIKGAYAIADVSVEDAFDPLVDLTAE